MQHDPDCGGWDGGLVGEIGGLVGEIWRMVDATGFHVTNTKHPLHHTTLPTPRTSHYTPSQPIPLAHPLSLPPLQEQYIFVYEALIEALKKRPTTIPVHDFSSWFHDVSNNNDALFAAQFEVGVACVLWV